VRAEHLYHLAFVSFNALINYFLLKGRPVALVVPRRRWRPGHPVWPHWRDRVVLPGGVRHHARTSPSPRNAAQRTCQFPRSCRPSGRRTHCGAPQDRLGC